MNLGLFLFTSKERLRMVFSFCTNSILAISSFFVDESGNKDILMIHNMNPNISAPLGFTILGIERVNKNS